MIKRGGLLVVLACAGVAGQAQDNVLATLKPSHPRLLTLDSDMPAVKAMIASDPVAKHNYQELRAMGDMMLGQPVIPDPGKAKMLAVSHKIEGRIFTLAGLYRITGEQKYATRARQEMLSAAGYKDWNPHHFLETAEMTAALGVGYDWLYTQMPAGERKTIREAIVNKGIQPWLDNIHGDAKLARMGNNWVQVCTGGITIGALAVADEDPARAKEVITLSRPIMKSIMELFAPDGGFEEGPKYWDYAISYNVLYLDGLTTALGTDFGLSDATGFNSTGDYRIQTIGPLFRAANFSDSYEHVPRAFEMYWLANRFHKPEYAIQEERFSAAKDKLPDARTLWMDERFAVFGVFWYKPLTGPAVVKAPLVESFSRIGQTYMRSGWDGDTPWYVGFKGGFNGAHHAHLDLGTFILDAEGERWAMDLGEEDYDVPGYFDFKEQRWTYYRTMTVGHNTLEVDGQNQAVDAHAPVVFAKQTATGEAAVLNLDEAYKGKLSGWKRGVSITGEKQMLVQDEVVPAGTHTIVWHLHTEAGVKIAASGREAVLSAGKATMKVKILSPAVGTFAVKDVSLSAPQEAAPGVRDLVIEFKDLKDAATIAVLFSGAQDAGTPAVGALSGWGTP